MNASLSKNLGPCPVCGRQMIDGPSVQTHHLIPKSRLSNKHGAQETVRLHAVCHRMVHKVFSEHALAECHGDLVQIRVHPDMARFIAWVQKKSPTFTDQPRTKGRRPYHKSR